LLLGAILVFGLILRLAVYFGLRATDLDFHSPPLDSRVFLDWAADIARGEVLGDRPFFLNPLYPYFLAPILKLTGEHHLPAIRIVQGLLGLLTVLLVAAATRRALGSRASLLAALVICSWPLLLFYEQAVMIVTLAVFLNSLTLFLLARFAEKRTPWAALLAGVPLGLSVLARPNVALFALMLPLWLATLAPRGGRLRFVALRMTVLFAGILAVILPVTLRNWIVGRDVVLVTSSMGLNLWQSNNPEARRTGLMTSLELRGHPLLIESDSITIAEQAEDRPLKPSEVSRYWSRRTAAAVGTSPGASAVFLVRKFLYFVSGDEPPSSHHFPAQREVCPWLRWNPLSFTILSPLALLGVFAALVACRAGLPLVMLYAAYAVGLTVFFPLAHYRAPVLPAAIPLAVLGVFHLAKSLAEKRGLRRGTAPAVLILALCATNLAAAAGALGIDSLAPYPDERVVFWYNRGLSHLGRNEDLAAERAFSRARAMDPSSWLPDQGMAVLARSRGESATEEAHLRRVLDRRGENAETVYMLGRSLFEQGRREEGLRLVERAARLGPRDPSVAECLGNLYLSLGRFEDALARLEAAESLGRRSARNTAVQSFCLRMLGRQEEARARIVRGLSSFQQSGPLHYEMAFLLIEEGAPREVIREQVLEGQAEGWEVPEELKRYID
jgi:4-amino-4-deoxy-L-arabinose transferase-like glycosyltransferase